MSCKNVSKIRGQVLSQIAPPICNEPFVKWENEGKVPLSVQPTLLNRTRRI